MKGDARGRAGVALGVSVELEDSGHFRALDLHAPAQYLVVCPPVLRAPACEEKEGFERKKE